MNVSKASEQTRHSSSEGFGIRKRSRTELDGRQPPHGLDHSPYSKLFNPTVELDFDKEDPHTSYSLALPRHPQDNTVRTMAKNTVSPLVDENQAEEHVKTEMELVALF